MRIKKELFSEFKELIKKDTEEFREEFKEVIKELELAGMDFERLPFIELDTGGVSVDLDILPKKVQEILKERLGESLKIFGELLLTAVKHDLLREIERLNIPSALKIIEDGLKDIDEEMKKVASLMRLQWKKRAH
mgnify:CR=1 FL=1